MSRLCARQGPIRGAVPESDVNAAKTASPFGLMLHTVHMPLCCVLDQPKETDPRLFFIICTLASVLYTHLPPQYFQNAASENKIRAFGTCHVI